MNWSIAFEPLLPAWLLIAAAIVTIALVLPGIIRRMRGAWIRAAAALILFAALFKIVPQVRIEWRDVWAGAALTALLFNLGKFVLGVYIGSRETTYGAGSSLLAVLLWTYYSAQIVFFGAEFTQSCARYRRYGTLAPHVDRSGEPAQ